ncbi:hypothetical protein [Methylobacterium sp.]|uniref:hypothetical protein n=1 Tax=Methylobacterium sp. TaxID=409 RepID=UPI0025DEDA3F|nr:hypothetical protein [Methylobacterium sp.]
MRSIHRRRVATALALILLAGPVLGQSATNPIETVRAVYAADDINDLRFLARPLRGLFEKDAQEAKGEVGRLGFAYHLNGQDRQDGLAKTLR